MQSWKRAIGGGFSAIYGAKHRFSGSPQGLRILMYHSIASHVSSNTNDLYSISQRRFKTHLDYLQGQQLDPDLAVHPFTALPKTGISFTFDDGYRDNLEVAAPLFGEYGFSFHVFINPRFVLSGERQYLTVQSLHELARIPGVSIGAHGYSHRKLTKCTRSELDYELVASKQWIEDAIGMEVTTMAYPHGAVSAEVQRATVDAGYTVAVSSKFGIVTSASNRLALERTDIWSTDTIRTFRSKLHGNWDWMSKRT
ncbi:MAG: polysaccharide deacetylase family protein [Ilumatobacteraceae bacterium]